jgi:hypothetical protein
MCPGYSIIDTFCAAAAAASPYHRLRLVFSSTRAPAAAAVLFHSCSLQSAAAVTHSSCFGYTIPGPLYVAVSATPVAAFALTSNSRRCQPVPPVSPAPRYMRYRRRRFVSPFPCCPCECCRRRRRRPRSCFNPTAEQIPATAISRISGTCNPHYHYRPRSPFPLPRGRLRAFLIYPHLPPRTKAYQLALGDVGHVALKSDTTQEIQTHPPS